MKIFLNCDISHTDIRVNNRSLLIEMHLDLVILRYDDASASTYLSLVPRLAIFYWRITTFSH
jgi:hypothetical protein